MKLHLVDLLNKAKQWHLWCKIIAFHHGFLRIRLRDLWENHLVFKLFEVLSTKLCWRLHVVWLSTLWLLLCHDKLAHFILMHRFSDLLKLILNICSFQFHLPQKVKKVGVFYTSRPECPWKLVLLQNVYHKEDPKVRMLLDKLNLILISWVEVLNCDLPIRFKDLVEDLKDWHLGLIQSIDDHPFPFFDCLD